MSLTQNFSLASNNITVDKNKTYLRGSLCLLDACITTSKYHNSTILPTCRVVMHTSLFEKASVLIG